MPQKNLKYIFIVGGVMSGAASIVQGICESSSKEMTNVQAQMTKEIKSPKSQKSHWSLSHWAFIGYWDLGIGIYNN